MILSCGARNFFLMLREEPRLRVLRKKISDNNILISGDRRKLRSEDLRDFTLLSSYYFLFFFSSWHNSPPVGQGLLIH